MLSGLCRGSRERGGIRSRSVLHNTDLAGRFHAQGKVFQIFPMASITAEYGNADLVGARHRVMMQRRTKLTREAFHHPPVPGAQ